MIYISYSFITKICNSYERPKQISKVHEDERMDKMD